MKKLLLYLKGYRKIDHISGLWKHSYTHPKGQNIVIADYSEYHIYYHEGKDQYEMLLSGFMPLKHFLYMHLKIIIDALNYKDDDLPYSGGIRDYFLEKEMMMAMFSFNMELSEVDSVLSDDKVVILKFDLSMDKDFIMKYHDNDPVKADIIQKFKNTESFPKSAEIYEEINNVIITSEGYFVATEKGNLKDIEKDEEEED